MRYKRFLFKFNGHDDKILDLSIANLEIKMMLGIEIYHEFYTSINSSLVRAYRKKDSVKPRNKLARHLKEKAKMEAKKYQSVADIPMQPHEYPWPQFSDKFSISETSLFLKVPMPESMKQALIGKRVRDVIDERLIHNKAFADLIISEMFGSSPTENITWYNLEYAE